MKKYFAVVLTVISGLFSSQATAQSLTDPNLFNHLGVGVHFGTTGYGFEIATPVSPFIAVRGGVTIFPGIKFNSDVDGSYSVANPVNGDVYDDSFTMDVKGDLSRVQGSLIFNIYPFTHFSSFYVAAGGYFGGGRIVKITGHSDELANLGSNDNPFIEIGDYKIPVDKNGNARGGLRANSFRPYLGLGFGRPVPKGRINFGVELGVQFMGKMEVYTDYGVIDDSMIDSDDDWQKWIDRLQVYPVLKFTLSGRIF